MRPSFEMARARSITLWTVAIVLWGLITHGTHAGTGDEPHYLAAAHSIAFDGDLDLSNNYGAREPLVGGGVLQPETHVRPGWNGVPRPVHDIGLPLAFAPYVRIAVPITKLLTRLFPPEVLQRARLNPPVLYRHLISLAMIALTVVLAGRLFDTFADFGASRGAAMAATLLVVLSPPLLIFSILFFTELLSALIAFVVFRAIVLQDVSGRMRWLLIGAAAGFLVLLHAKNIGLTIPLAALAVASLRDRSRRAEAIAFAAGTAFVVVLRTLVNYHFWGSMVGGPHARFVTEWPGLPATIRETMYRATALLSDQEFGLLPYAPIMLLAIPGFISLARSRRDVAWPIALVIVFYGSLIVCPLTNIHGWTGGWNPPARFLTPIVPLLGVFVYAGLRAAPGILILPLLVLQIAIDGYAWQHPKILWNDGDGRAAFCDTTGSRICAYLPSLAKGSR
ncbi:MAG TPA: hypothetical protein VH740_13745 [Vicinamibacterales bacterium]